MPGRCWRRQAVVILGAGVALAACGGGGDTAPQSRVPARVVATSDTAQVVAAGTAAGTPPTVRVVDTSGDPVGGATVQFTVASGAGVLAGAGPRTNAQGAARLTTWTVDTAVGTDNIVEASIAGADTIPPVRFHALSSGTVRYGPYDEIAGTHGYGLAANYLNLQEITVAHDMTLDALVISTDSAPAATEAVMAIYSSTTGAKPVPDTLIAAGTGTAIPATGGVTRFAVGPVHLAAGTYWIGFDAKNGIYFRKSNDYTTYASTSLTYGSALPHTFPQTTTSYGQSETTLWAEGTVP